MRIHLRVNTIRFTAEHWRSAWHFFLSVFWKNRANRSVLRKNRTLIRLMSLVGIPYCLSNLHSVSLSKLSNAFSWNSFQIHHWVYLIRDQQDNPWWPNWWTEFWPGKWAANFWCIWRMSLEEVFYSAIYQRVSDHRDVVQHWPLLFIKVCITILSDCDVKGSKICLPSIMVGRDFAHIHDVFRSVPPSGNTLWIIETCSD